MNEKWTEKVIDAHLEASNIAEPSLGFESRMLARVAEKRETRRPVFWLVFATTAAAVVIGIVFLARPVPPKPTQVQAAKTTPTQAAPVRPVPRVGPNLVVAMRRNAPKQPHHEAIVTAANVRQEVFPAPSPLSEQERLAFAYLRSTPRSEVVAMSRPEPEIPQEINQVVPAPEVNRTLPSSTR